MKTDLTLNGQLFWTQFPFPSTTSPYVHSGDIYLQMKNYTD